MYKDWSETADELSALFKAFRKGHPDVAKGFSAIAQAATAEGALSPKVKELIALAISIATRCDGCIAFHTKAAVKNGATRDEILEMIGMSIYMGGGPSLTYGAQALEAFDQLSDEQGGSSEP